jgi:hypothetical protein
MNDLVGAIPQRGPSDMNCPYGIGFHHDDRMEMIRHHHEGFEIDIKEMMLQIFPTVVNDHAQRAQLHLSLNDTAKDAFSSQCA